jgi:hypothetical protein
MKTKTVYIYLVGSGGEREDPDDGSVYLALWGRQSTKSWEFVEQTCYVLQRDRRWP